MDMKMRDSLDDQIKIDQKDPEISEPLPEGYFDETREFSNLPDLIDNTTDSKLESILQYDNLLPPLYKSPSSSDDLETNNKSDQKSASESDFLSSQKSQTQNESLGIKRKHSLSFSQENEKHFPSQNTINTFPVNFPTSITLTEPSDSQPLVNSSPLRSQIFTDKSQNEIMSSTKNLVFQFSNSTINKGFVELSHFNGTKSFSKTDKLIANEFSGSDSSSHDDSFQNNQPPTPDLTPINTSLAVCSQESDSETNSDYQQSSTNQSLQELTNVYRVPEIQENLTETDSFQQSFTDEILNLETTIESYSKQRRPSILSLNDFDTEGHEVIDLLNNGAVVKTILNHGDTSLSYPINGQIAKIQYIVFVEGLNITSEKQMIEVEIGSSDVVPGLDLCLRSMYPKEKCRLFVKSIYAFNNIGWKIGSMDIPPNSDLKFSVILINFEDFPQPSIENKERVLDICKTKIETANRYFNEEVDLHAIKLYSSCKKYLEMIEPSHPLLISCQNNLGVCKFRNKKYSEALNHFESVIKAEPNNYLALFRMSQCKDNLGDFNSAIALMERVKFLKDKSIIEFDNLIIDYEKILSSLYEKKRKTESELKEFYKRMFIPKKSSVVKEEQKFDLPPETWSWKNIAITSACVVGIGFSIAFLIRRYSN